MKSIFAELRSFLTGWKEYFRLAATPSAFQELDECIRRRLRAVQLKQWRSGSKVYRELRARGATQRYARAAAAHARRWWKTAAHGAVQTAPSMSYYDQQGVPRLAA